MPKRLLHFTFICFILTALTGIWMRLFAFTNKISIVDYSNIIHAHSHMAILGWTFLGVFIIFLALNWNEITNKKHASAIVTSVFVVSIGLFLAFFYQGYATYSIILSTLHIFVEYWVAIFMFSHMKRNNAIPKISKLFLRGSLLTLIISSIGPFGLGALAANSLRESPVFDMAIYFYLHFQYNGWLYLMLIGLFSYILIKKGISLNVTLLKISFWSYFVALFPGVFLSLLWFDFGLIGMPLAIIGAVGMLVGVFIFCYAVVEIRKELQINYTTFIHYSIWIAIGLLLMKSVMELGLLSPELGALVYDTRAVVIGYLHLTLLGFISLFILVQLQMIGLIDSTRKIIIGISVFLIGFVLNEVVLFLSGMYTWFNFGNLPLAQHLLLVASILLFIGIAIIWLANKPGKNT